MNNEKKIVTTSKSEQYGREASGLSAPWTIYYRKLWALFDDDDDIFVGECFPDKGGYMLEIKTFKKKKFEALQLLLPDKVTFGNVELRIYVYYVEDDEEDDKVDYSKLIADLFEGNDIFSEMLNVVDHAGAVHHYAAFNPHALQFFTDNLADPYGNSTVLAQDVAREIFRDMVGNEVRFCTSLIV